MSYFTSSSLTVGITLLLVNVSDYMEKKTLTVLFQVFLLMFYRGCYSQLHQPEK